MKEKGNKKNKEMQQQKMFEESGQKRKLKRG